MVAVTAAPAASTVSAASLHDVATLLAEIVAQGDAIPWAVGEAVSIAFQANAPANETPADARKRLRAMCKALSAETGIGTSTLVERCDVHTAFPKGEREIYPDVPYSVFREVWRNADGEGDIYPWLDQAQKHGWKAHQVREAMRSPGGTPTPKRESRTFEDAEVRLVMVPGPNGRMFPSHDFTLKRNVYDELDAILSKPGVTFTLRAEWPGTASA